MLSIRMQRTGRKGHAQYRVVVQDSRQSPTSGKTIARLGHYDPHTKVAVLDKEKAATFLSNGAQPSDRVVSLFTHEKIDMPSWVKVAGKKDRSIRNPEKLRRNQPKEEKAEEPVVEAEVDEASPEAEPEAAPAEEAVADETPAEEPAAEETAKEEPAEAPVEEATEEPAAEAEETPEEKPAK